MKSSSSSVRPRHTMNLTTEESAHQHINTLSESLVRNDRITDLDNHVSNLKHLLEMSRQRELKLLQKLEDVGIKTIALDIEMQETKLSKYGKCPLEPEVSFLSSLLDRGGWLIGLLIFQSCSSIVLNFNESLLRNHPKIIYFLTMLVGAGGNAGNQAAVRAIRGIALGTLGETNAYHFIFREFLMACSLSLLLGTVGVIRVFVSTYSVTETFAIIVALMIIVFVSVVFGALLPLLLKALRIDPAHSSTSIQVIMDILGVTLTCIVSSSFLDTVAGRAFLTSIGFFS